VKIYQVLALAGSCFFLFPGCKTQKSASDENAPEVSFAPVAVDAKPVYKGSAKKDFILRHTALELTPDWKTHTLKGLALLTLQVGAYPQDTLVLDARGMEISGNVHFMGEEFPDLGDEMPVNDPVLNYRTDGKKIYIRIPRRLEPGKEFKVRIAYTAHPEDQLKKGLIDKSSNQGLYFINPDGKDSIEPRQMWSQGEVQNNCAWFPTIDEPDQKMTQEIYLTVDTSLVTLSNGELVYSNLNKGGTRTDYWKLDKPHAPYLAMIAAGEWKVTHDEWRDSIPVDYYLEKRYAPYAHTIFGTTPEMIEFFSKRLGVDYPWPKFSQVVAREFVTGAMENTSAVVHYDPVQHDNRQHLDNTQEDIISHELFHHWFGDLVTCESWGDVALNESFATLGEALWLEHKYGKDEADLHLKENLDEYLTETVYTVDAIINHTYTDPDNIFDAHRYQKGGLVLNMLRNYLGDTVFFKGLQDYLLKNAYSSVELFDLRKAMEETSGQDLNWFFDEWFLKPGHPILQVTHEYQPDQKRYRLVVIQQQSLPSVPVFNIPVKVDIYQAGASKTSQIIWLKDWNDTFYFPVNERPVLVNFDADNIILGAKTETKPPRQWYAEFMYGSMRDKDEALDALEEMSGGISNDSMKQIISKGLSDPFWYNRKRTIETVLYNYQKLQDKYVDEFGIRKLAKSDPSSKVRSAAIGHLARLDQGLTTFYEALSDSSYLVIANAIHALLQKAEKSDSLQVLEAIRPLENLHGSDALLAIAEAYARYGPADKTSFFHTAYPWISGQSFSRYIDYYSRYLATQPISILKSEQEFLLGIGDHANDMWSIVLYKNMLQNYVTELKKKNDKSGLSESDREALISAFQAKLDIMTDKAKKEDED
jgi:aminopeptidase N